MAAWGKRTLPYVGLVLVTGACAVLTGFILHNLTTPQDQPGSTTCVPRPVPQRSTRDADKPPPVAVKAVNLEPIRLAFLESHHAQRARLVFESSKALSGSARPVADVGSEFVDVDHARHIPINNIQLAARQSNSARQLIVRICVDRDAVLPGKYSGTVQVDAKGVEPATARMEITVRDDRWVLAILWSLLAALVGAVIKTATDVVKLQATPKGTTVTVQKQYSDSGWKLLALRMEELSFWLSLVVGIIGALAAFFVLYLDNESFGASSNDWFKLATVCFGATVSGMTVTDIGKRLPKYGVIGAGSNGEDGHA